MVVGIDLGTTHSLVAFLDRGVPRVIPDAQGHLLVPSVVSFLESGTLVGGEAKKHLLTHFDKSVYSIKRLMGKKRSDLGEDHCFLPFPLVEKNGVLALEISGQCYTPQEISAMILKALRENAEAYLKEPVEQAVITVPAYFNHVQREATIEAGKIAGLEVLRVINEPTAASLIYGLHKKKEGVIVVYDLGGGTFDVSLLKICGGVFEVLATNGNTRLGGDDVDQTLTEWICDDITAQHEVDLRHDPKILQELRLIAEAAKCTLSDQMSCELSFQNAEYGIDYNRFLQREEFDRLIGPWIGQTVAHCKTALADARLTPRNVDEVILVGGSTRIPAVQKAVAGFFGKTPHCEIPPEEAVALGAAISANILAGDATDTLLLDVTPLSLGIESVGGVVSRLIPRNTTVPASAKEVYTTSVDGQTSVFIHVVQGEREQVSDCQSLAQFHLSGIDPMPAGVPRIEVTFMLDANGILNVSAVEQRTGKKQTIRVKPSYGLAESQVADHVMDAQQHREDDINAHRLIEAKNNADTLIRHVQKGLREGNSLIDGLECQQIEQSLAELLRACAGTDAAYIAESARRLEQVTKHLAEVWMSAAFSQSLEKS